MDGLPLNLQSPEVYKYSGEETGVFKEVSLLEELYGGKGVRKDFDAVFGLAGCGPQCLVNGQQLCLDSENY